MKLQDSIYLAEQKETKKKQNTTGKLDSKLSEDEGEIKDS